ncbi:AzlC family ABC transporter permease [Vagococcus sp.]|uniref:AzlC family ABC transporter permease n=1 Tax=Vagococcus sp. TaxID=1933889 RepID=UPI003F95FA82
MNGDLDVKAAAKETLPTVFGYIGIGVAFGVVGHASGLSPWLILLMTIVVYGGSAQFITVSMLASHSPFLSIVFSTFLVNSRMILMSMTLAPYFQTLSLKRNLWLGTLLTDESFALGMNKLNFTNRKLSFAWLNTSNLISYSTWVLSSFLGAILGNFITSPEKLGLDFALLAMFIGLLILQIISDRKLNFNLQLTLVAVTFVLIYIGLIFIPMNLLIVLVTLVGCGIGMVIKHAFY